MFENEYFYTSCMPSLALALVCPLARLDHDARPNWFQSFFVLNVLVFRGNLH